MIPLITTLLVWSLILLAVALVLTVLAIRFLNHGRRYKKTCEEYLKKVEIQTRKEYNKIASLPPKELGDFLAEVFSRELVLEAKIAISEKDPSGIERLYGNALSRMMLYLGDETVSAINFYYGDGYVNRWCEHAYRMLAMSGVVNGIIANSLSVEAVRRNL